MAAVLLPIKLRCVETMLSLQISPHHGDNQGLKTNSLQYIFMEILPLLFGHCT